MGENNSTANVAELLQQLEDLKRKRAQKLLQLQKLERRNRKYTSNLSKGLNQSDGDISLFDVQNTSLESRTNQELTELKLKCPCCDAVFNSANKYCIQCKNQENDKNKNINGFQCSNTPSKIKKSYSENILNVNQPTFCEPSDLKSSHKLVEGHENLCLAEVIKVHQNSTNCDQNLFSEDKNVLGDPNLTNEILKNSCNEISKQRKRRSISMLPETIENSYEKKLRIFEDLKQETENYDSTAGGTLEGNNVLPPQNKCSDGKANFLEEGEMEDSLSHNMTCFLSSSLLMDSNEKQNNEDPSKCIPMKDKALEFENSTVVVASELPTELSLKSSDKSTSRHLEGNESNTREDNFIPMQNPFFDKQNCIEEADETCSEQNDVPKVVHESCDIICSLFLATEKSNILPLNDVADFENPNAELDSNETLDINDPRPNSESFLKDHFPDDASGKWHTANNLCNSIANKTHLDISEMSCDSLNKKDLVPTIIPKYLESGNRSPKLINTDTEIQLIQVDSQEELEDNLTPSLLDSPSQLTFKCVNLMEHYGADAKDSSEACPKHIAADVADNDCSDLFGTDDAFTSDFDFDSSTSEEDMVQESCRQSTIHLEPKNDDNFKIPTVKTLHQPEISDTKCCLDSEIYIIPETEMFESSRDNKKNYVNPSKCDTADKGTGLLNDKERTSNLRSCTGSESNEILMLDVKFEEEQVNKQKATSNNWESLGHNSGSPVSCEKFDAWDFVDDSFSESLSQNLNIFEAIPETNIIEDTMELERCKHIPFLSGENVENNSQGLKDFSDDSMSNIKFTYCMHSDVCEPVIDLKLTVFNSNYYAFIQQSASIQVWRQKENDAWDKIFSHQVDESLEMKEMCFSKNDTHLVLMMLHHSEQRHCVQFLLFEKDTRFIKLLEGWLQNRCSNEMVLLCGLEDLKFAVAQGKDTFDVFVHSLSSLEDNPRLLIASLGSTVDSLHSLCRIEKLPNALMGASNSMLYVWHLQETRLVTSVSLQPLHLLPIERCIWSTIEKGLVFFMAVLESNESLEVCQLYAANLATGFCQIAMPYSMMPALEIRSSDKRKVKAVYCEPFLVASSEEGSYLWSVEDEYCCAALDKCSRVTTITIIPNTDDTYIIAIGNTEGCVKCYTLSCSGL